MLWLWLSEMHIRIYIEIVFSLQSHTILLVQPTKRPEGRTYADYESVNECMEGVCKMYEEHLKRMNPNSPSITYDISQFLILLMIWQISAVLFTELIHRHTSLITKTGSKRRSTCSFVDRPNKLGSSWVGSIRGWGWAWNRCIQRAVVNILYDSNPVSILLR